MLRSGGVAGRRLWPAAARRPPDQFIGEPDMIGRGHWLGAELLFIEGQRDTPRVIIHPTPTNNARAIRAYQKTGLQRDRLVETPRWSSISHGP
jgi:hypothetical protein